MENAPQISTCFFNKTSEANEKTKSTIAPKMSAELKNVVSKMSPKFFRAASTTNKKSLIF